MRKKKILSALSLASLIAGATLLSGCVSEKKVPSGKYKCDIEITDNYNDEIYDVSWSEGNLLLYDNGTGIWNTDFGNYSVFIDYSSRREHEVKGYDITCFDISLKPKTETTEKLDKSVLCYSEKAGVLSIIGEKRTDEYYEKISSSCEK